MGDIKCTFIALIPKGRELSTFNEFMLVSLCNLVYKLITKTIENMLKGILSDVTSEEQFGFLYNRKIHDVMGKSHKGMHIIKNHNIISIVMKLCIAKAHDKVN